MKRGKRFLENDNMFIYIGTAIFAMLALIIGIIMYMTAKTGVRIENESGQISQETQTGENTESVSTEMGKTVEEQQDNDSQENSSNSTVAKTQEEITSESTKNISDENTESQGSTSTKKENTVTTTSNKTETTPDEKDTSSEINQPTESQANTQIESSVEETKKEITFIKPTEGEIICEFAKDNLIYSETLKEWITHTAIDIKADKTSVIKSAADGIIESIVNDPRYGLTVVISHDDGYETVYSNLLTAEFVVEGEEVTQGQTIGTAGNTASFESNMECHLHFELLKDGEYLNPAIYLK